MNRINVKNVLTESLNQDSYTDGGKHDGSPLNAPVLHSPNPSAGGRYTNGPLWAEYLANASGATLKDYAVSVFIVNPGFMYLSAQVSSQMQGAVVDASQWPGLTSVSSDFLTQGTA